jgi:hypothetical protein
MLLGDMIEQLGDPAVADEMLLSLEPLALCVAVRECADEENLSAGEYCARSINRYISGASEEEWVTLIGQMSRCERPGVVLLKRALSAAIADSSKTCRQAAG